MGHVHFEQVNDGKGTHESFDYVPFSDPKVLSELICNRMKLDVSYAEKCYPSGVLSSVGGMVFNESILATYVSLDALIEAAPLTKKQNAVIQLLMRGYTIQDITDECGIEDHSRVSHIFSRALQVLTETNTKRWMEVTAKLYLDD